MAMIQNFDIISGKFILMGICTRKNYGHTGSLNCIIVTVLFLLASPLRISIWRKTGAICFSFLFLKSKLYIRH